MPEPFIEGTSRDGAGMDKASTEDILTDLLYIAIMLTPGEIQDLLADVIVKVGDGLTPEAVERSKDYAKYKLTQRLPGQS